MIIPFHRLENESQRGEEKIRCRTVSVEVGPGLARASGGDGPW